MKTKDERPHLVQMPLRCNMELQERIIRALGITMSKTGKKLSKNEFLVRLVEMGLQQVEPE